MFAMGSAVSRTGVSVLSNVEADSVAGWARARFNDFSFAEADSVGSTAIPIPMCHGSARIGPHLFRCAAHGMDDLVVRLRVIEL